MNVREVGVVGLGTMGAGIAEVLARAGLQATAAEADAGAAEAARVLAAMHAGYGDPAFAPLPLLREYAVGGLTSLRR